MSIIKKPLVTEKMTGLQDRGTIQYGFVVDHGANKQQIKAEIERVYEVEITGIRTMVYAGKARARMTRSGFLKGRTPKYKKAIVTLASGQTIDFYKNI
ncbi:MAG: 50S ribosomal protein L23 [Bacteroidia bacterium]|nr:50S ribosomal protein L23 [Bacteroidia bacterium]